MNRGRGRPGRLRSTLRIARWEVSRATGTLDRRTLAVGLLALLLAGGAGGAATATGASGLALDRDVYRVGVEAGSPYAEAVAADDSLAARPASVDALRAGEIDLLVVPADFDRYPRLAAELRGGTVALLDGPDGERLAVAAADSSKGEAAAAAFRAAVERYNDRLMAAESNRTAAYPVFVTVQYAERSGASNPGVGSGGSTDGPTQPSGGETASGGGDGGGGSDDGEVASAESDGGGGLAVPSLGGSLGAPTTGSPASVRPPFPFGSLVLAFAFLVPMNFLSQAYGSSVLGERVNRRGELLLVAPVSPAEIVAGKTLPYGLAAVAATVAVALVVGGGALSVAAVLPVALLFLAATFVGAMFARSYKELTFVTVTVSVLLTSYVFVPAIFAEVTPIALISPLTLVVWDLQGRAATAGQFAFAVGPFLLSSSVLFHLGAGVYREEDMFTQKPVPAKLLDALAVRLRGYRSAALLSALFVPFVFVAELLAVAVLFVLPVTVSVPTLLLVVACVEEVAKSAHVYAGFARDRFAPRLKTALALGAASGVGFFLGEKATVVVQLVGLPELALGTAAFAPSGVAGPHAAALLLAPLALHVVTACVSAAGARGSRGVYALGLTAAISVHAAYNLLVVTLYA